MQVYVNGKLNPYVALGFFLSYVLIIGSLSFFQDKDDVLMQLNMINNGAISKTTLLVTQGIGALFLFFFIPFLFLKLMGISISDIFLKHTNYKIQHYGYVLLLVIGFMPFNTYIAEWNALLPFPQKLVEMEQTATELTKAITSFGSVTEFLVGFFVIAIIAGIGEELTFRAILQNLFQKVAKNHHLAIWISAILFSAIHVQFLGFIPRMLLGALFGYIYVWSGNITLAMFGHFVNNGFAVVMMHLYNLKVIETDLDKTDNIPISIAIVSLLFSGFTIYQLKRNISNLKISND